MEINNHFVNKFTHPTGTRWERREQGMRKLCKRDRERRRKVTAKV
jgi:hypothetical protein